MNLPQTISRLLFFALLVLPVGVVSMTLLYDLVLYFICTRKQRERKVIIARLDAGTSEYVLSRVPFNISRLQLVIFGKIAILVLIYVCPVLMLLASGLKPNSADLAASGIIIAAYTVISIVITLGFAIKMTRL